MTAPSRNLPADHAVRGTRVVARPVTISRAYEQVAAQIRARIVSGELRNGDRLPSEIAIAKSARVSRSTVREALRMLEEAGFVERASPRVLVVHADRSDELYEGTRALRRSGVSFDDLCEALLALDPALTRLAAQNAGESDIARLEAHLEAQMAVLSEPAAWTKLDDDFHVSIAEISQNTPLILARRPISAVLLPTMERFVRDERMTRAAVTYHERIVEEIKAADPEAAAFMTRKHINDFRRAWHRAGLDPRQTIGVVDGASE